MTFENETTASFVIPIIEMKYGTWRILLLLCSLLSGTTSILLCFLPESPKFLLAQEKHDEALSILKEVYHRNRKQVSIYPVTAITLDELLVKRSSEDLTFWQQVLKQTSPLFKSPLLINTIRTSFIMFSIFAASSGFFMWTPDILNKLLDYRYKNYTVCDVVDEVVNLKLM